MNRCIFLNLILVHPVNKNVFENNQTDLFILSYDLGWEWFNTERSLSISKDFRNHIVIADFFTYCCINCMHILPDLQTIESRYPEETGVVVVSKLFHLFAQTPSMQHILIFP